MRAMKTLLLASAAALLAMPAAHALAVPPGEQAQASALIPVEQFTLENGLKVVFHVDRSDPVVAVALNAHVGSGRELPGRTGFAHLFEHLFFLDSENLGPGGLDAMSARIGGSGANGSTSRDITDYLQTVPRDALEKMIWAEADKLGFFINTVTEDVVAKEIQVVKNEKRQGVDNQPYGHLDTVIVRNLYPEGHPYSWPVIGSLPDLDAATLEDVHAFYRRWYTPNNVTLVIAGDFDPAQARAWVERYFAEIPRGSEAERMTPRPAALAETRRLFHEDRMARLPQLALAWPGAPALDEDAYALSILMDLLTVGRSAPLHAVLVDERKLTAQVTAFSYASQIAGEARMIVRAFDGVPLDTVRAALDEGFARFEAEGIDPAALERAKVRQEVSLYRSLDSVLGKAARVARYDLYAGDPGFADRDLANIRAVTADDVMRVYDRYIKDRPHVAASFVPQGQQALVLAGSERAEVYEEPIVQGAEAPVRQAEAAPSRARTPSRIDRTVEPPFGPAPVLSLPDIWEARLANGLAVQGIEDGELPMARFALVVDGGRLLDDMERPGAGSLLARMLTRGTARRTPAELEEALELLGAEIDARVENEAFVIGGRTLARNFEPTMALLREMLLEPRWDPEELALAKAETTSAIQAMRGQPNAIAARLFERATYGDAHIYSRPLLGTEQSVAALTMDDLVRHHAAALAPNRARFRLVGPVDAARAEAALAALGRDWAPRETAIPAYPAPAMPERPRLLFVDMPGAAQSVFAFGHPGPARGDEDFYPAFVANYILGGGGFASRFTQQLREGQGYTYGIRSAFDGGRQAGLFRIDTGVRANVTLEAARLIRRILADYPETFADADMDVTRSFLTRARARAFETQDAKLAYLGLVGDHGLPADYPLREQAIVDAMTTGEVRALARRNIHPDAMTYVVVGDAATQAARLGELGLGEPRIVTPDGPLD